MIGILVDLILYLMFSAFDDDSRGSNVFIPFEDQQGQGQGPPEPQTDFSPEDFEDFGDF